MAGGDLPAADYGRGELLVTNHCRSCHESTVHTRPDRLGTSPERVRAQILRWQSNLGLNWSAEEVEDAFHYLNLRFYRFHEATPAPPGARETPRSSG